MDNLDYVINWVKTATKQQRHVEAIENFARNNHSIFMQFHETTKGIINNPEGSEEYNNAKEELVKLFSENKAAFQPLIEAIKAQAVNQ